MQLLREIACPKCLSKKFSVKYESTYVYSYKIEPPNSTEPKDENGLSFLFDNREQKGFKQYIECLECKTQYPCQFTMDSKNIDFTILSKAIRSNYVEKPEFFG
ncbi:hypothetical protein [Serpentinicella alkaliphila]|uniref:Uncharacterized protein n=1 Tax=Serpentinicella alkaliphila TaxID=1734049 RepID=A0A4R2U4Z0_9FIRM|nr:hypothetical protein [Serpentinicella alkaliphila]QUH27063.1 hypothetical protein HZR23_15945 [Serpentinicella alkaliphila]TCQ05189.1 hypothetical protein EDD79_10054 [Serpentinicella alkaliphila]